MNTQEEIVDVLLTQLAEKLADPKNHQIRVRLRQMLDNADMADLRDVMHLSGYRSVDYSFIEEDVLRVQLEVDNLRMEDAENTTMIQNDEERFYNFCINAFYQIENILNYYYVKAYPSTSDMFEHLESTTKFKRRKSPQGAYIENNVGDVPIAFKTFSFCTDFFPATEKNFNPVLSNLMGLREVRNEGFHRCQILCKTTGEKLCEFYRYNDFNSVRDLLKKIVSKVKEDLEDPAEFDLDIQLVQKLPSGFVVHIIAIGKNIVINTPNQMLSSEDSHIGDSFHICLNRRTGKIITIEKNEQSIQF